MQKECIFPLFVSTISMLSVGPKQYLREALPSAFTFMFPRLGAVAPGWGPPYHRRRLTYSSLHLAAAGTGARDPHQQWRRQRRHRIVLSTQGRFHCTAETRYRSKQTYPSSTYYCLSQRGIIKEILRNFLLVGRSSLGIYECYVIITYLFVFK